MASKPIGMTLAQAHTVKRMLERAHAREVFILRESTTLYSVHAVDNQTGYPYGVYTYPLIRIELPQRSS